MKLVNTMVFVLGHNSCVESLIFNVMALRNGAFGRWLGQERGVLMSEIRIDHILSRER
jgi:hypothetical protein